MKTEDLKEKGLTDEQISYVMAENGKSIKALQDENKKLKDESEAYKKRAETAEETLKSFEGKDFDAMTKELEGYKKKAEESKAEYDRQIAERDFNDALKAEIEGYKFTSESAKKAVMNEIKSAGLKLSNGKILGLTDLISQIKEKDSGAFIDEKQEKLEENKAKFTTSLKGSGQNGALTKEDIMKIKDANERQQAIAQHIDLFK